MIENRFHDSAIGIDVIHVMPGTLYVTCKGECITTILGSCISVCLHDPIVKVSGLNHFMLPGKQDDCTTNFDSNSYGVHAMTELIVKMETMGAQIYRCEAKIFGGGCMFPNDQDIGVRNIEFASNYLDKMNISLSNMDVGLNYSRRIRFHTDTGKVMVKRLRSLHNKQISNQEALYESDLTKRNAVIDHHSSYPTVDK